MQLAYDHALAQEAQAYAETLNVLDDLVPSGVEGESLYKGQFDSWEQTMAPTDFWYR